MRKTIGIDLDDVLLDFNGALCGYHNMRYEPKYAWENIHTFALEDRWQCTREEARRRIYEFYATREHAEARPVQGAPEALRTIAQTHDCVVITSRPESVKDMTLHWCQRHFPNVFQKVHFTNQFGSDFAEKHKGHICQELGIDIFVEDAPHHALDVAQAGTPVLLYDVPWNQAIKIHPNITRVYSWNDILKRLL